ncbi:MAG: hypothetical protein MUE54_13480 [Anaerolineae bacterium]|jgi:hypothetical protein|nr:hypothetical protein [Anaerolineae bacterium]
MGFVEITGREQVLIRQQRLGHFLTILVIILGLLYSLNLRGGVVSATVPYTDLQAGIRVNYPANWLLDTLGGSDYVFRVRDMSRTGFKTTLQVSLRPVSADMTERNVLDALNINRPISLSTYDIQSVEQIMLTSETPATLMRYTYVDTENNPFLESFPIVVAGEDILTLSGGQAIIITFRADARTFDQDRAIFLQFLRTLEF